MIGTPDLDIGLGTLIHFFEGYRDVTRDERRNAKRQCRFSAIHGWPPGVPSVPVQQVQQVQRYSTVQQVQQTAGAQAMVILFKNSSDLSSGRRPKSKSDEFLVVTAMVAKI